MKVVMRLGRLTIIIEKIKEDIKKEKALNP